MSSSSWFVPFRHPSPTDLELWLEDQAADGRILTGYSRWSPVRMKFTDSAPATVRYAVERRSVPAPIDYFRFREAQGWEHVGNAADFHIWSRPYRGARPTGFIGEDLDRRASLLGIGLGVFAAVAFALAAVLGALAGLVTFESLSPAGLWAPAVAAGIVGLIACSGAVALRSSGSSASSKAVEADERARISV
ncbi:DUF2812 domain-containing protein [Gordonia neofelifaecis]|uniref:DUF2812 domain-containing protein n=1 Tax=Gordonia neofelifaecis NRRL B-59395 TaxID=644548 RepID=F1YL11_9ACTN|nr:DUF2812 domain-containing protein [Gordonia neofelifaecis]EGD54616.1 hypothetical protein SCNU_13578 [Gordonia neofelifaecis NRRL B-59395]